MKKIITLFVVCLFISIGSAAQQQFQLSYHPYQRQDAKFMAHDVDGGYLLASDITDSSGEKSIMFTRFDSQFSILWNKLINEPGVVERVNSFWQDTNGDIYIAGCIEGTITQALTIKTDSSLNIIWKNIYPYASYNSSAFRIAKIVSGSVFVIGYSQDDNTSITQEMSLLMKLNSAGVLQWAKTYPVSVYPCRNVDMLVINDSNLIVASRNESLNNEYASLARFDSSGNTTWIKRWLALDFECCDAVFDITFSDSGGYVLYGFSKTWMTNGYRNYIMLCDSSGNSIRTIRFYFPPYIYWWQRIMKPVIGLQTADGGYAVTGYLSNSGIVLLKLSDSLTVQWCRLYSVSISNPNTPYPAMGISLLQSSDDGYVIAGNTLDSSIALIKTDSLGWSSCHESSILVSDTVEGLPLITIIFTMQAPPILQDNYYGTVQVQTGNFNTDSLCNIITSISPEDINEDISLSPNPATTEITITPAASGAETKIVSVEIYDVLGKEISKVQMAKGKNKIDVSKLSPGIYFIKVKTETGERVAKFVKQ